GSSMQLNGTTLNITAAWANGGSDLYSGSDYNAPRLLQPVNPSANWLVETKFDFAPGNNFESAGILLATTTGAFSTPSQYSRSIERYANPGGGVGDILGSTGDSAPTTWFRLQKIGINYTEWWSADGVTWNYGGVSTDTNQWTCVGLFVIRQPWDNAQVNASANFYYFHVTAVGVPAHTYTWVGGVSSDWFNTNNWFPNGVPGGADTAIINSGAPVIDAATNVGTVIFNGGSLNAGPDLVISNSFNWTNGNVAGVLTIPSGATMNLGSYGGSLNLGNAVLINNGTVNWGGGAVQGNSGTAITNNGAWLDLVDSQFNNNGGWTFYNNGSFIKSVSPGTTSFSGVAYNNNGSTIIESGTLAFQSGGYLNGTFTTTNGTVANFNNGAFAPGPALNLNGSGASVLTGGSLTLSNIIANLQMDGGAVYLAPTFQGGSITNLTLTGSMLSGSSTVSGALTLQGGGVSGSLYVDSGA